MPALLMLAAMAHGQPRLSLDDYVREGLANNLVLKQQKLMLEKSGQSVRQASGLFMPSVTLNARYTQLGGNVVNLGDALNPAYAALNQLTNSSAFPTDLDFRLPLRQETKVSITQPLLQPNVLFNYQIQNSLYSATEAATHVSERDLAAKIKTAYLTHAKTTRVVELYEKTLPLLDENVRVNERLVANQKATLDALYRAKAELSDVKQKLADAERQQDAAAQYFNYLLARPLGSEIQAIADDALAEELTMSLDDAQAKAKSSREELMQLKAGIAASETSVSINTANFFPTLSLGIDYGFQGNRYDFRSGQDFFTASLVAQWNIFNGFQDDAKRQQAVIETKRLETQLADTENLIALQVRQAHNDVCVAKQAIQTASDRLLAAQKSFELIAKKYEQGKAAQVEYLEARTAYTNAGINEIITRYDYFIKQVEMERAAGLYKLNN
jgi:outer membrane protein TolC